MKVILNRDVTAEECPWIPRDFKKGDEVYIYTGHTYGCITRTGTACSEVEGETPFFELPTVALGDNDKEVVMEIKDGMITIEKIDHLMEDKHPNGINTGYQKTGTMDKTPTVGERFTVARIGGYLQTSPVTEIVEETPDGGVFKTNNSMYRWSKIKVEENGSN